MTGDPDQALHSYFRDGGPSGLAPGETVGHTHVLVGSLRTGLRPAETVERLGRLGFRVEAGPLPDRVVPEDAVLLSAGLNGVPPWVPVGRPVPVGHLLRAAAVTGRAPVAVARRLAALGHQVPDAPPESARERDDVWLMSAFLDGRPSWLDPAQPVSADHVLAAAAKLSRGPHAVTQRLVALGYQVADVPVTEALPGDQVLMSVQLTGLPPRLPLRQRVTDTHLVRAAAVTGQTPEAVRDRLAALGYQVPDSPPRSAPVPDDVVLMSRLLDGRPSWLDLNAPVPARHVLLAAVVTGRAPQDVAGRLTALGYSVPEVPPAVTPEDGDRVLLSSGLDGESPWLDPSRRVDADHIRRACRALRRDPARVIARLEQLGFRH